jgi:hypothetical protein
MGPNMLKEEIPRLKVFGMIWGLRLEVFHGLISRKGRIVNAGHERP